MRRWGCATSVHASLGLCRSLVPLSLDLEKSSDMVGARRIERSSRAHPWNLKRALKLAAYSTVRACYVSIS